MAMLMDMNGQCCGHIGDNEEAPSGYWKRADDLPEVLTSLEFMDRIGPARFASIYAVMQQNPALAFAVFRGFAATQVEMVQSFPMLMQLESARMIPAGTAIAVWS